jgi:predicted metal-dependent phosphoesterase TrpH
MFSQVDLHLHTTASDGVHSPEDIVAKAAARGLEIISICDHDTVEGVGPALAAAADYSGLTLIPGVEVSTDFQKGEVHVLGYYIDHNHSGFNRTLKTMRQSRVERARAMVKKLVELGIHIEWDRVRELAGGGSIGRPHIAQALLEKGHIVTIGDAFYNYLGRGRPAYVERIKMSPREAVALILDAGGLPVLAHPMTIDEPEAIISSLAAAGLVGLEAYYGGSSPGQIESLVQTAAKLGLIATGGSDYHGLDDNNETPIGGVPVPMKAALKLIGLAEERDLKAAAIKERR